MHTLPDPVFDVAGPDSGFGLAGTEKNRMQMCTKQIT